MEWMKESKRLGEPTGTRDLVEHCISIQELTKLPSCTVL